MPKNEMTESKSILSNVRNRYKGLLSPITLILGLVCFTLCSWAGWITLREELFISIIWGIVSYFVIMFAIATIDERWYRRVSIVASVIVAVFAILFIINR